MVVGRMYMSVKFGKFRNPELIRASLRDSKAD
jgi:hypothetical protein